MLRITKESEYAFMLLSALLRHDTPQSAASLSASTGLAEPITGKVLKRLVRDGILQSVRGIYGGYQLSRPPETITALAVVEAIEGDLQLVDCVNHHAEPCALAHRCQISTFWQQLNHEIAALLRRRTLAEMQRQDFFKSD